jgi:hypothetical protein
MIKRSNFRRPKLQFYEIESFCKIVLEIDKVLGGLYFRGFSLT